MNMKNILMRIVMACGAIITALTLSSCQLFSPVKPPEINKYAIKKIPQDIVRHKRHRKTLLVLPVESRPAYNTTQMAYSSWPYQVAYFAKNEWIETPGQMLLPLVIQTLQNTNYYRAIVTSGYAGTYEYALYLQLLNAKDDFNDLPPQFELTIRAQILKMSTGRITATKTFFIEEPLRYRTPFSGVVAANAAAAEFQRRLAAFCLRNAR